MYPICVIGSGLSGYNLAREIRRLDKEIPLCIITSDDGHYYSKPQLSTALTQGKTADNLAMLTIDKMRTQLNAKILEFTEITKIKPSEKRITMKTKNKRNKKNIEYSKLVLAWGAETIDPNLQGTGTDQVFSVNDLVDYRHFRNALINKNHITILGSGLIGCEFANDLINANHKVEIVSLDHVPLQNLLPHEAAQAVANSLEKIGIKWNWGTTIKQVDKQDDQDKLLVTLENTKTFTTDLVISAIGLKPRTILAKDADIAVNAGIIVNKFLETSQPDIYAIGDCAEVCGHIFQHILPLNYEAKALAKTLTSERTAVQYPAMPVSIKTPACPVVASPPPPNTPGQWKVQEAGNHVKALFIDQNDKLIGFALTGDRVRDRLEMINLIPHPSLISK